MPSAQKDQTHETKPKKTKKIKRMISIMRRQAPPLPADRRIGSGAKRENPETGKSRKPLAHPAIKGPKALIARSAKRTKKTKHAVRRTSPSATRLGAKKDNQD